MAKYTFCIEADSIKELLEKVRTELNIMSDQEEEALENEKIIRRKVSVRFRDGKQWTEFEINFLVENYQSKSIEWISKKLNRKKASINQKLFQMYKKGLAKKNNRVKNIC